MSLRSHAEFAEEVVRRSAVADANARREYVAARRIQSVWRGHHMRQYIKKLHRSAAIVQRCYRGYRARRYYFQVLEQAVQTQTEQFYGRRAVLIQKTYRGFASRRNVFDYYRLKAWLKQIVCKGAELEEETWNYFFDERNRKLEENNAIARKLCVYIAKKLHHLLRTHQTSGVYSNAKSNALSQIERLLASFSFRNFHREVTALKNNERHKFLAKREQLYERTAMGHTRHSRCEPHLRHRQLDAWEMQLRPPTVRQEPSLKVGLVRHPYVKTMLATEKYCDNIMAMTREFDILTADRDFCLNTRIAQRPDRIEEFIEVLHKFCVAHDLIEK